MRKLPISLPCFDVVEFRFPDLTKRNGGDPPPPPPPDDPDDEDKEK